MGCIQSRSVDEREQRREARQVKRRVSVSSSMSLRVPDKTAAADNKDSKNSKENKEPQMRERSDSRAEWAADVDVIRQEAQRYGDEMSALFAQADKARDQDDHASANEFVQQAKEKQAAMHAANKRAKERVLRDQNSNDDIDLHCLLVKEAEEVVEEFLQRTSGDVTIITGAGNHSKGGHSKVKARVHEMLREKKLSFEEINNGSVRVSRS
ncbi:MAG: hypothetical protein MHM6MM_008130 [Cercozoa sp. M6MM]